MSSTSVPAGLDQSLDSLIKANKSKSKPTNKRKSSSQSAVRPPHKKPQHLPDIRVTVINDQALKNKKKSEVIKKKPAHAPLTTKRLMTQTAANKSEKVKKALETSVGVKVWNIRHDIDRESFTVRIFLFFFVEKIEIFFFKIVV